MKLIESDKSSDEESDKINEAKDKVNFRLQLYGERFMRWQYQEQEQMNGPTWESNVELEEPNMMETKKSKIED